MWTTFRSVATHAFYNCGGTRKVSLLPYGECGGLTEAGDVDHSTDRRYPVLFLASGEQS